MNTCDDLKAKSYVEVDISDLDKCSKVSVRQNDTERERAHFIETSDGYRCDFQREQEMIHIVKRGNSEHNGSVGDCTEVEPSEYES